MRNVSSAMCPGPPTTASMSAGEEAIAAQVVMMMIMMMGCIGLDDDNNDDDDAQVSIPYISGQVVTKSLYYFPILYRYHSQTLPKSYTCKEGGGVLHICQEFVVTFLFNVDCCYVSAEAQQWGGWGGAGCPG